MDAPASRRPTVLLLSLNYAPEPIGIGPYSTGLAEGLAARGHPIEVIAGQPYYPEWRIHADYRGRGWHNTHENGVTVTRCPHYVPQHPGTVRRIAHLASFALCALPVALRAALRPAAKRPRVVLAIMPTLAGVLTAWLAARLAGAKLWIHVQDFEVAAAQATGLLPTTGPLARLAAGAERWLLRRAERVSAISPQMCGRLIAMGIAAQQVLEVRNWADPSFAPDAKAGDALRTEWGLGGRKVALYSGTIARKQGIAILIEAARQLAQRDDLVFVICGAGPGWVELQQLAATLPNVQLHGLQPATRMGALLAMADLHLLPQIEEAADLVLPSKLTNMMASGRPVVATAAPGTGLYAEIAGCGVATPPGDARALAAAITALADDTPRRAALGSAARQRAAERWHRDTIIDRVAAELISLG